MLDLVKLCLAPCCSCFQSPVVREDMSYVFCTKDKLERLESAMKDLMVKMNGIDRELNLLQNRGKQPTDELQRWLHKKFSFKSGVDNNNKRRILVDCEKEWWESLEWEWDYAGIIDYATITSQLQPLYLLEWANALFAC
ncbi:hypothetical protein IHE45_13G072400 [Dioscorea alata]|uniref:Uncharacterized protein n=1 Tax=Dioscorea alata TaxID=55571 RepID=A0ACB7UYT3_DIOAL|nr:hypothetical protein IHE45_13G072400 [Dioscorea alata]